MSSIAGTKSVIKMELYKSDNETECENFINHDEVRDEIWISKSLGNHLLKPEIFSLFKGMDKEMKPVHESATFYFHGSLRISTMWIPHQLYVCCKWVTIKTKT